MAVVSGFQINTFLVLGSAVPSVLMPAAAAKTEQDPHVCFLPSIQTIATTGGTVGYPIG